MQWNGDLQEDRKSPIPMNAPPPTTHPHPLPLPCRPPYTVVAPRHVTGGGEGGDLTRREGGDDATDTLLRKRVLSDAIRSWVRV